jgi:predicted nucleic acid-binding protein
VLYPASLRDLLVQLAVARLFRAKWSDTIHNEWTRSVLANRPDLKPEQLKYTVDQMNRAVPDALAFGFDHLIPSISLPDADDRHVVATAIHSKADGIVTFNLADFPDSMLKAYGLESIHPDDFIIAQMDLNEAAVVMAAQKVRARLKSPLLSVAAYLRSLEMQQLPKTVARLRTYAEII